nr:type VI secretion protein [Pseudomonas sp. Irchel 3A5]
MSVRPRHAIALCLFLALGLSGCSGHYRFSDHEYRPLGEPLAVNRGN